MAHLLGGEALCLEYPTKKVFDSVTLGVNEGERIGIVGSNGDGKSSLLAVLTKRLRPDSGQVTYRRDLRVGMLGQSDDLDESISVRQAVVQDEPEYVWASNPKIRDIVTGLLSGIDWTKTIATLSGGQRRRVALAQVLVGQWDVLCLDEPTNHLDLAGIAWLASHLKNRWPKNQGALLVVTHDRWFLDEVATLTWQVHDGVVDAFEGGYAAYTLQRVERERLRAAAETKRQNLLRKELAWLRRGAPARTSKPKFRIDAANELIADVPEIRNKIELTRLSMARLGKRVVDLLNAGVSFGDHNVLANVTWRLAPGERTGILGVNGAGKSTLLGLIAGKLTPTSGRVRHGKTVQIGVLDQQFSALVAIGNDRVREVLSRTKTTFEVGGRELNPAQLLERLGFSSTHLSSHVSDLSGGQKRRLQLLLVLLEQPNVLILDEPTNDVDTDMLTALEDLLDTWPGTLIVVSHDRYLVERVTDQQYAIIDSTLRHLPGGIDEYLELTKTRQNPQTPSQSPQQPKETDSLSSADFRAHQKRLEAIERKLKRLKAERTELEGKISTHDAADYVWLTSQGEAIEKLINQEDALETEWLEICEELPEG